MTLNISLMFCLGEVELLDEDLSDDDPQRDVKDIAFAQAYLEKVC